MTQLIVVFEKEPNKLISKRDIEQIEKSNIEFRTRSTKESIHKFFDEKKKDLHPDLRAICLVDHSVRTDQDFQTNVSFRDIISELQAKFGPFVYYADDDRTRLEAMVDLVGPRRLYKPDDLQIDMLIKLFEYEFEQQNPTATSVTAGAQLAREAPEPQKDKGYADAETILNATRKPNEVPDENLTYDEYIAKWFSSPATFTRLSQAIRTPEYKEYRAKKSRIVIPVIGPEFCRPDLAHSHIAEGKAHQHNYPSVERHSLPSVQSWIIARHHVGSLADYRDTWKVELEELQDIYLAALSSNTGMDNAIKNLVRLKFPGYIYVAADNVLYKKIQENTNVQPHRLLLDWRDMNELTDAVDQDYNPKHPGEEIHLLSGKYRDGKESHFSTDLQNQQQHPFLLYPYGNLDIAESMILTETDYIKFLSNSEKILENMRDLQNLIRAHATLLFIGFDGKELVDWSFRFLIRRLLGLDATKDEFRLEKTGYILQTPREYEDNQKRDIEAYFGAMNIAPIWATSEKFLEVLSSKVSVS